MLPKIPVRAETLIGTLIFTHCLALAKLANEASNMSRRASILAVVRVFCDAVDQFGGVKMQGLGCFVVQLIKVEE